MATIRRRAPAGGAGRQSAMKRLSKAALGLAAACASALLSAGCVERQVAQVVAPGDLRIVSLTADPPIVAVSGSSQIQAVVDNPKGSAVSYFWQAYRGTIGGVGAEVTYFGSYCCAGTDWVVLTVENEEGEKHTSTLVLTVLSE